MYNKLGTVIAIALAIFPFAAVLAKMAPSELMLDLNPEDAVKLGVRDGQSVRVISKRAELTALTRLTSCMKPGEVYLPMHDGRVNQLTHASFDPLSRQPSYKHSAVRVEAAVTDGEEFANSLRSRLYSKNNVFRSVIGIDRPTFIPFISETSATLTRRLTWVGDATVILLMSDSFSPRYRLAISRSSCAWTASRTAPSTMMPPSTERTSSRASGTTSRNTRCSPDR